MKTSSTVFVALVIVCQFPSALLGQEPKTGSTKLPASSAEALAELYEHLANSIIAIRTTEDNLVRGMLVEYHASAQRHLADAAEKSGERTSHLEAAASSIADIANEGDKRARAVRQRLSEAGHYHQKDTETAEDFMFINSKEKKSLFALAKKVGQLGANASPTEIKKAGDELKALFTKAIGRD
jgi:hypothetical protein